jgi:hypothetical protein
MTVCYSFPAWVPPVFAALFGAAIVTGITLGLIERRRRNDW